MMSFNNLRFSVGETAFRILKREVIKFGQNIITNRLKNCISECSKNQRLLLIVTNVNGNKVVSNIDLPPDQFTIYESSYDARELQIVDNFLPEKEEMKPFAGLFSCPSPTHPFMNLLFEIESDDDIPHCLEIYQEVFSTHSDREQIEIDHTDRFFIDEQEYKFQQLEREAIEDEEGESENIIKTEQNHQNESNYNEIKMRFNSLPQEPEENEKTTISIKIRMPDGSLKTRRFRKTEQIQNLIDFVYIDTYPHFPIIKFGFPTQIIENYSETFEERGFSRKELVTVEI